jgi:hypothetical protein
MTGSGADRTYYVQQCNNSFSTEATIIDSIFVGAVHSISQNGIIGDPGNWCSPTHWQSTFIKNNVTDISASTDSTTPTYPLDSLFNQGPMTTAPFGGTNNVYGQSAASLFVDPANDFRLKAGSPAKGVGIPFAIISRSTDNTVDFFGATRAKSYSAGAVQ